MACSSGDDGYPEQSEDLSYSDLDVFPDFLLERATEVKHLQIDHNQISILPRCIGQFTNLISLDISNNQMTYLSGEIAQLQNLKCLTAKNNLFDNYSIPKELDQLVSLQSINLSGNQLTEFPMQLVELTALKCIHLGGNAITDVPREISNLTDLEILYLGGNRLEELPFEMGRLVNLVALILCDNKLLSLPSSMSCLRRLQSLSLHNNKLSTLPPEIVTLDLIELSLRNNPLVVRFVEEMIFQPPSLLELAGRTVKTRRVPFNEEDIPRNLFEYLNSAHSCVNPKCKGVYFTQRVEHIKFVDFCGKYRLPLMEYLCSPLCVTAPAVAYSSESESEDEGMAVETKMRRVLLG